jgi:hypothetical protein
VFEIFITLLYISKIQTGNFPFSRTNTCGEGDWIEGYKCSIQQNIDGFNLETGERGIKHWIKA